MDFLSAPIRRMRANSAVSGQEKSRHSSVNVSVAASEGVRSALSFKVCGERAAPPAGNSAIGALRYALAISLGARASLRRAYGHALGPFVMRQA